MPETFVKLFVTFMLISVGALAIISFASTTGIINKANQTVLDNEAINKTFIQLGGNISAAEITASAQREAVTREQVEIPEGSFLLVSVVGTAARFGDIIIGVYNITLGVIFNFIGFGNEVFGALATILLAVAIFAGWKTFKTGT